MISNFLKLKLISCSNTYNESNLFEWDYENNKLFLNSLMADF